MGAVTVQTAVPTANPGALGAGVAPLISTAKLEVAFDLPDTLRGKLKFRLLRWSVADSKWYPVNGGEMEVNADPPSVLAGKASFLFDNPAATYYCILQTTASATVAGSVASIAE